MRDRGGRRRGAGKRFAMLPIDLLEHEAVRSLSHAEFRVLTLIAASYNGRNNGELALTVTEAYRHGIRSNRTVYRAFLALSERGLIRETYPASRVPPRPTMFAITWRSLDDTRFTNCTRTATHDYRGWRAA